DDVLRRADLRVPAPEVDERLSLGGRRHGDAGQERHEVLLRQPLNPFRRLAHRMMLCRTFVAAPMVADPGPGLDGHAARPAWPLGGAAKSAPMAVSRVRWRDARAVERTWRSGSASVPGARRRSAGRSSSSSRPIRATRARRYA